MITSTLDFTGLLEPQKQHAFTLLNSLYLNGVASDTSETGCGKTFCAAWIAKQFNAPVVVICPKSVIPTWEKILKSFGIKSIIIINFEKLMRGSTPYIKFRKPQIDPNTGLPKQEWRYQLVHAHFPAGSLLIVDEAHKCKGMSSLNSGLLIALKRQGYKILTLSATQATDPTEMKAFGYATNLHNLYHWKDWCIDHGAEDNGRYGIKFDNENENSQKKMSLCHENLFNIQQISSRLTREQMGSLFPDNHIQAEAYDLGSNSPKIQAVYDEMEWEIAELDERTQDYSGHIFAVIMKARRRAEMLKIPLFQEMFEDSYDEGKSVIVFLNFTESIEALASRLHGQNKFHKKIGFVYGEKTFKERWLDIDDFQADRKRGLICNLKAGGASLSFHDLIGKHGRDTLLSPSFSAIDMLQALGRTHRQGAKTSCYQRIVYAAKCIEEKACFKVQYRLNNLSCLVDGDLTSGFKLFS